MEKILTQKKNLKLIGKAGEDQALSFLKAKGYQWVASNFSTKWGEIDLVMKSNTHIIFVEVKKREGKTYGEPEEAVHFAKQRHLVKSANVFLHRLGDPELSVRFDVLSIGPEGVRHIENAFEAGSDYYY